MPEKPNGPGTLRASAAVSIAGGPAVHTTHADVAKRLKRATGHLRSVVAMIEEGRPCVEIAQQLHAVERAVAQAKRTLIHDHLDHCLDATLEAGPTVRRRTAEEFRAIAKYL